MPPPTYDHRWKEVRVLNGYCMLMAYMGFVNKGIGFLVVTWATVVLLGGFVSMIDKQDFWRLTLITLIQMLGINDSFKEKEFYARDLVSRLKGMKDLFMPKWQLTDNARGVRHPNLAVVERVVAEVRWVLALVHYALLQFCTVLVLCLSVFGLLITTSLSIYGLVKHEYYGDTDEGRTNMYPAHNVVYVLCVAQGALLLYRAVMFGWQNSLVHEVSQTYGFQDDRAVKRYRGEIQRGCEKNPSSARERNLITFAIELMESDSPPRCHSGTLILDRLLTRQYSGQIKAPTLIQQDEEKQRQQFDLGDKALPQLTKEEERSKMREERRKNKHQQREEAIIAHQRRMIKRLIGSASCTHILQKLLDTLDSRRLCDKKMREAAARIVGHVASGIRLEEFPRGIECISSLIDNFEQYRRLQPYVSSSPPSNRDENNGDDQEQGSSSSYSSSESESEQQSEPTSEYSESDPESESYNGIRQPSSSKTLNGYKDLVLTGLSILWSLADSEKNCIIISNTKHLISKIMAPVSYDLVHRTNHSAWSTSVVEASMRVMLRFITTTKDTKGDTGVELHEHISNKIAITTMEKIVTCEECKGGELQMTAMQILMQLSRGSFTQMLVELFVKGDSGDDSIRKTAGKELVRLFLGSKSVAALLPKKENYEFVGRLAQIVSRVENDDACRKGAAEILEHMCIHYTEYDEYLLLQKEQNEEYLRKKKGNEEYLSTLKNAMASVMPKVLREILLGGGLTREEGKPRYREPGTDTESQVVADRKTNKKKGSSTSPSPWQNKHHKLHVTLLSLYVTACEKLHLDIDAISSGEGDQGEGVAFRFAKRMVHSNRHRITTDSLTVIKLSTRMVIATMMKFQGTGRPVVKPAHLETLMDKLSRTSETMLDLEGSIVFAAGTTTVPATADTLDSLVKRAQELHNEIKNQGSEIVPAS